jgi:uncharacterized repeat protein (TIGR02543 family)
MKKLIMLILAMGMCLSFASCAWLMDSISSDNSSVSESSDSASEEEEDVTITFKQSGYSDVVKTVKQGEALTDIPDPQAKTGYTVVWDKTSFTNITEDIVVNAVATANKYTITYNANGGELANQTQEVTFDSETTLVTPTREDYIFNGWMYEGAAVVNGEAWTIADNVTLVAEWIDNRPTYTVTFVDGTQSKTVEVTKGESVSASDVPAFVGKVGYSVAWDITDYTNIQENITVTAVYTANTYTVTYDANGFAMDGTTVQLTYDALCTALDMTLTKEDANFLGWKYCEATYTNESVWNVADNVTITPDWEAKDQVTVVFTDTDGSTINKTIYAGQNLTDIPTPKAKVGYTIESVWYTDEACTQTAVFTNVQAGFTVYAKATANTYKVSYDANGGTMSELTQDIAFDSEYTLETPTHEKEYMRFDGWEMESGSILAQAGKWTLTDNISVTAKWTDVRVIYTISFVQAGQETKTFEVKEGESFTDVPTPVAKTGYTVEWDTTDFTVVAGNMTVTAVETAKTYTITLNANGGKVSNTKITVIYGETYELPTPMHNDKAFVCWMYNGKKIAMTGIWSLDIDESIVFVAQWGKSEWTDFY